MNAQLYIIPGPWPGRLAIVPRPRGGDWLEDEATAWRRAGIDVVVPLLTPDEVGDLDLADEERACRANGIDFVAFPIPDRGVPSSAADAGQLVGTLERALAEGKTVAVHCRQGIGRSALVAAAVLVRSGVDEDESWRRIADARGRPVPETDEQRAWVTAFGQQSFTTSKRERGTPFLPR